MRGNAGRHADRNTVRPVYQKVGNTDREHLRLFFRLVKIRDPVDHILVQILQIDLLRDLHQAGLRITHGGGSVSLDGSEISVSVHQRLSLFEILRHDDKRVVDGTVPVRVIFTHGIAHNSGRFPVRSVPVGAELQHVIQCPPLYRLQSVPDIRKRA